MKKIFRAMPIIIAAAVLSGCSGEEPPLNAVDAGGLSYSYGTPALSVSASDESSVATAKAVTTDTTDKTDKTTSAQELPHEALGEESVPLPETTEPSEPTDPTPPSPSESRAEYTGTTASVTAKPVQSSAEQQEVTDEAEETEETEEPPIVTTASSGSAPKVPVISGQNSYHALNYADVKGVWISYIELSELLAGKSEDAFRTAIGGAFDNCAALGLNTVYVHVRSHGDAYYPSKLFPWSKYASGTFGSSPGFDPLAIMIEEAHERSLSFHAWINPLRGCKTSELSGAEGFPLYEWANGDETSGKYVVSVGGVWYLNPAYEEVIEYIAAGAAEIAANYDVDGVHIDDYFYPTTDASFDSAAYAASGYDTISSFRLSNCDKLVSSIYKAVKTANSSALFGVSCQGSFSNNYNQMYADVKKWCAEEGYLDYITPQIYYGFNNSTEPYEECVSEWNAACAAGGTPLIVGLSASKIGLEDKWAGAGKNEWIEDSDILARQLRYALEQSCFGGVCLYSYRSVFSPDSAVSGRVSEEISSFKAVLNE